MELKNPGASIKITIALAAFFFACGVLSHNAEAGNDSRYGSIASQTTFFLPSECVRTHSLIAADGYVFGSIWSHATSSCIWRINPTSGEVMYATSSQSGIRVGGDRMLYDKSRDTLYAIETNPATYLLTVNPHTLAVKSYPLPIEEPAMSLPSMTADGSYLYVVNNVAYPADSILYKLSMRDYTVVATSSLPGGNYHAIIYDGHYLYMSSTAPDAYVVKTDINLNVIDVSNPSRSKLCSGYTDNIAEAGNYLYFGCEFGFYGVRMNKNNFEKHSLMYVGGSQFAVTYNGKYVVYGIYSGLSYGKIAVIDPATLKMVTIKVDDGSPNEIVDDGTNLFATIWGTNRVIMFSTIIDSNGTKKVLSRKVSNPRSR